MVDAYLWSNTLNAFIFIQGSMTPTLVDLVMTIGLNISYSATPFSLLDLISHKITTRDIGGWAKYITAYSRIGFVGDRE